MKNNYKIPILFLGFLGHVCFSISNLGYPKHKVIVRSEENCHPSLWNEFHWTLWVLQRKRWRNVLSKPLQI